MTTSIRADFPLLGRTVDGVRLTYLDSAATSLKPAAVLEAESSYSTRFTANVHRGTSLLSDEATHLYESARRRVARFIGADPDCVVMTPNATHALGLVAAGLGLSDQDVVLCSPNSHHSNLLPWLRRGPVAYVGGDPLAPLDPDEVTAAIKKFRPKVLAFGWVSNVNGVVSPVGEVCRAAREHGVVIVVDAAQAAPHLRIEVDALGCDFLAFSGHKMLGPAGTGVLWGRREQLERLTPLVLGGGTVDRVTMSGYVLRPLPHRLEPGTPNVGGVLGLGAALQYLDDHGRDRLESHELELGTAMRELLESVPGTRVLTAPAGSRGIALASVVPLGGSLHSDVLCRILSDSYKVITRSGFHCAHPLFETQGYARGAVRLSAYFYNTVEDVQLAARALRETCSRFAS